MGIAAMKVPTVFTAQDRFSSVLSTMTKNTRTFGAGMNRLDNRINNSFSSLNRFSQLAIAGGAGALFYKAGQDIVDYEVKINSLAAVTGTKIGSMNKQIESLGKKTSRSVIDIAGSFEIVGSKMSQYLDNPVALQKITDSSILMAEAARMELEPAISSLTGVMNIYRMSAEQASKVVNKLSAGETVGSVSIAQTADILTQFGAQAVRANAPIEESIALIQTLTKSLGVEGVGRGLRNILFDISSTETWDKNRWRAIKMAGVDFKFVTNNANSLVDRLRELKKLSGVKGAMELFFKRTGTVAANTLFQNFDKDGFTDFLGKIKALDDAQSKANKNNATFATLWARTKDAFTNYIVTQNETNAGLNVMKGSLGWLKDNMGTVINLVVGVAVAFVGWKIIFGIVTLATNAVRLFTFVMTTSRAIMEAYNLTMLAASISGRSFIGMLLSGTAPMLAWAAPLLAIVAILGLVAWSMHNSSVTSKKMMDDKTTHFKIISGAYETMEQRIARSNERIVSNMKKFKMDLESVKKTGKTIAELRGDQGTTATRTFEGDALKRNIGKSSSILSTVPKRLVMSKVISDSDQAYNDIMGGKKENLAGTRSANLVNDISNKINKQQVEVIIKDPGNNAESVKVNGKDYGSGIPARTNSTTGIKK